ncbi:DUF6326 family protein [Methanolobus sp. ZRKC5]|uniref:DUF6326 family protein n=1 Tax=unclassified Methanolobus TaxID=2629569 RepID=UPI00313E7940
MDSIKKTTGILEDVKINVKLKLSALWVAVMGLYVYVDIFDLYRPGEMEHIIAGNMGPFPTTQVSLLLAMVLMMIPSLMIFLSMALPAKANRWTNIIVGILSIVVVIGNVIGESWVFYIFGSIVEFVLLSLIVEYAWKWPKQEL